MQNIDDMNECELEKEIIRLESLLVSLERIRIISERSVGYPAGKSASVSRFDIDVDENACRQREIYAAMSKAVAAENYEQAAAYREILKEFV